MRSPELPPLAVYHLFLIFFLFDIHFVFFFSCTAHRRLAGPPLRVSGEVCVLSINAPYIYISLYLHTHTR